MAFVPSKPERQSNNRIFKQRSPTIDCMIFDLDVEVRTQGRPTAAFERAAYRDCRMSNKINCLVRWIFDLLAAIKCTCVVCHSREIDVANIKWAGASFTNL